jgi:hypothetical protein
MSTREEGKVKSVSIDNERISIEIDFGRPVNLNYESPEFAIRTQYFPFTVNDAGVGPLERQILSSRVPTKTVVLADFEEKLRKLFGVNDLKDTVGAACIALRPWDGFQFIDGIEVNGNRLLVPNSKDRPIELRHRVLGSLTALTQSIHQFCAKNSDELLSERNEAHERFVRQYALTIIRDLDELSKTDTFVDWTINWDHPFQ